MGICNASPKEKKTMIVDQRNKETYKYIGEYECEYGEETHFTIIKKESELLAGTILNAGFSECYNWEYDEFFSLDENLNDFIEYINESEIQLI